MLEYILAFVAFFISAIYIAILATDLLDIGLMLAIILKKGGK